MAYPRVLRNFNAFVDGVSFFGVATEATLPAVKIQTEAHRGAGMDGSIGIDMGTEGMTSDITFSEHDPFLLKKLGATTRFVLRPALAAEDLTDVRTVIATVGGLVTTPESGGLKGGANSTLKLTMDVRYYRLEIDSEEIWEIDLINGIRKVGGTDQLVEIRKAMGI